MDRIVRRVSYSMDGTQKIEINWTVRNKEKKVKWIKRLLD